MHMNLQDLDSSGPVRNSDLNLPVKAAGAAQCRIDGLFPVSGSDDHHLAALLQAVHHGQQLGHHPSLHLARDLAPLGGDGVDLIDEYDGGGRLLGVIEDLPQPLLALPVVLGHYLRAGDGKEVGTALIGHRFGDEGLSRARRTVEQDALGRLDAQLQEDLRVLHGQLDHLPHPLHLGAQAAHVLVGGAGGLHGEDALGRLFQQHDLGSLADDHHISRMGLGYHERHGLHAPHEGMGSRAHDGQYIAGHDRALEGLAADHVCRLVSIVHLRAGGRSQDDALGVGEFGFANIHPVSDAHARILADEAVYSDVILRPVLPVGAPDLGGCKPFSLDLNDVPG